MENCDKSKRDILSIKENIQRELGLIGLDLDEVIESLRGIHANHSTQCLQRMLEDEGGVSVDTPYWLFCMYRLTELLDKYRTYN